MALRDALLALSLVSSSAAAAASRGSWPVYFLNNSIGVEKNAVCLDGSPGAFYIRRNPLSSQWRIFLEGGGWCYDEYDCADRATYDLGSSNAYPPSIDADYVGGIMSSDLLVNPTFADANSVYMKYCDGNSFAGGRAAPLVVPGAEVSPIHFRGQAIVDATLETLVADFGLDGASELLLTGCSAGGLATYLHAESVGAWASANLPSLTKYGAAPVSGNFLRCESVLGEPVYPEEMKTIFNLSHAAAAGGGVPAACLAAKSDEDAWQCNFAREAYATSTVPTFVLDSSLDSWQTSNVMVPPGTAPTAWDACADYENTDATACSAEQMFAVWAYQGDFVTSLATTDQHTANGNGAFVYNCHTHCAGADDSAYANFTVNGTTMAQAVDVWWASMQDDDYDATAHTYTDALYNSDGTSPNPTCYVPCPTC